MFASRKSSATEHATHQIFCIAASTGGFEAIETILARLDESFSGSLFITQHIGDSGSRCYLAELFQRKTRLTCVLVSERMPISAGTAYFAAPGTHLIINEDEAIPAMGPKENYSRPAADPMFRSAAVHYRSKTVGIVLTGMLDDGTAGLSAIKHCGGRAVVQDPATAVSRSMPISAIKHCDVDAVLPPDEIAGHIIELTRTACGESHQPSDAMIEELRFAMSVKSDIRIENRIGEISPYMCPDCGGQMWKMNDQTVPRFRCHVGHAHTLSSLTSQHGDSVERLGWALLRTLEERNQLLLEMRDHELQLGREESADFYRIKAQKCESQAQSVRRAIELVGDRPATPTSLPSVNLPVMDAAAST